VLRALGLDEAQAEASIRFSFGRFTTDEEIEEAQRLIIATLEHVASQGGTKEQVRRKAT